MEIYTRMLNSQITLVKWNPEGLGIFWINPPDGRAHGLNASNQKTDATLKNQLFEYYNFALHTQDDSCTLNALKMQVVFGSGVSAPAWNAADMHVCNIARQSWNARTKDKVHF